MMLVSLYPADAGLWNIRLGRITLFRELSLDAAIELARQTACQEHLRTGEDTCLEMPSLGGPVRLALHERRSFAALENADAAAVAHA